MRTMSVTGQRMVGIPVVLLHEGEGLILTVETRNGWIYRGYCEKTKDNFNMKMVQVVATDDNGNQYHMSEVLLRGSTIRYVIFPDILRYSPMFKRVELRKKGIVVAGGLGRGRQQAIAKKGMCARKNTCCHFFSFCRDPQLLVLFIYYTVQYKKEQ